MEARLWPPARTGRSLLDAVRDRHCPPVLAAGFWLLLASTVVAQAVNYAGIRARFGFGVVIAVAVAQAVTWRLLPWKRGGDRRRLLAIPAFMLAGLAALVVTDYGVPGWTLLIGVANVVLLLGVPASLAYAGAVLTGLFAGTVTYPGHGLRDAVYQTAAAAVLFGLAIGAAAAFAELRRRRDESQRLLRELEQAHAELRRRADRAAELAIAEERTRMSREMHDSIGHLLTVVKMGLENAERFRTRIPETAWQEVRQAKEQTQEALDEVRRCVRALRPLSLERQVAPRAMAALVESFAGTGMEVTFDVSGAERCLRSDAELVLYRALQEGLTNAVRHSGASHVRACLTFAAGEVVVVVEDDGRGAREDAGDRGFGLAALAQRAGAIGGSMSAGGRPGGGFALRVSVPAPP